MLWDKQDLLCAVDGLLNGDISKEINGVSIDSRSINDGDIFIALDGENVNGHLFVNDAIKNGASVVIVQKDCDVSPSINVDDTLLALERIGEYSRNRFTGKTIGVTGSVGKTTTKEMLKLVLSSFGKVSASDRSFNNHIGVPLSLSRLPKDCDYGIFEIGSNHSGEILDRTKKVLPDVAVITKIGEGHVGMFGSIKEIAKEKSSIFFGGKSSIAVIHADTPYFDFLYSKAMENGINKLISFGIHKKANVRLLTCELKWDYTDVVIDVDGVKLNYRLYAPGENMVMNSLCTLSVCHSLGLDLQKAAECIQWFSPIYGRGKKSLVRWKDGEITIIDESYNAMPTSMRSALEILGRSNTKKIAVIGDMGELGEYSSEFHKNIISTIGKNDVDLVFACGTLMKELFDMLPDERKGFYAKTASELIDPLKLAINCGDTIMIKGSLFMGMSKVVESLRGCE